MTLRKIATQETHDREDAARGTPTGSCLPVETVRVASSRVHNSKRPSRLGVYDDRSGSRARHSPPRGTGQLKRYFLAMKVYLPSWPLVGSSQVTVHLPSELNLAFTLPFLVS